MQTAIKITETSTQPRFRPPDDGSVCGFCAYFKRLEVCKGACRRHAPVDLEEYVCGVWPVVNDDDWCGDFALALPMPKALSEGGAR
jgi:hypothetical protein